MEEKDLDDYVTRVVAEPTNDDGKTTYKKNQAKAKRILFDSMKDHLILYFSPLKTAKECYDALIKLFETKILSRKRALKGKLRNVKMMKNATIATFFTKISQLKDQLAAVGENVEDDDPV